MPPQHRQRDSLEFLNNWGLFMGWGLICDFESIFAQVVFWIISMLSLYHLSWKITSQHWDKVTRDITACKIAPVTILQFATFRIQTGMKVDKFTLQNRMILRVLVLAAWASAELPKVVFSSILHDNFCPRYIGERATFLGQTWPCQRQCLSLEV